jgi:hypothetical protein
MRDEICYSPAFYRPRTQPRVVGEQTPSARSVRSPLSADPLQFALYEVKLSRTLAYAQLLGAYLLYLPIAIFVCPSTAFLCAEQSRLKDQVDWDNALRTGEGCARERPHVFATSRPYACRQSHKKPVCEARPSLRLGIALPCGLECTCSVRAQPFPWSILAPIWHCSTEERVGEIFDGGKWVCDPRLARKPDCVIYSFGSDLKVPR